MLNFEDLKLYFVQVLDTLNKVEKAVSSKFILALTVIAFIIAVIGEIRNWIPKPEAVSKNEFEKDIDKNRKNYLTLKEEVESFVRFHEMKPFMQTKIGEKDPKNENFDSVLINRLKKIINEFKKVDNDKKNEGINWE